MKVKDMIRYDCFWCKDRLLQALAWSYDPDSGPVLIIRHFSGLMTLISEVEFEVEPTQYGLFRSSYEIGDGSWESRKQWRRSRRRIRVQIYQYCPSLETSQYVRDLLLEYKTGVMHRAGKAYSCKERCREFDGKASYDQLSTPVSKKLRPPFYLMHFPGPVQTVA